MLQHSYHTLVCAEITYAGHPMVTCSRSPIVGSYYCFYFFLTWKPIKGFYFVVV